MGAAFLNGVGQSFNWANVQAFGASVWQNCTKANAQAVANGVGTGGSMSEYANNEATIKQGRNYLLASVAQQAQLTFFYNDLLKFIKDFGTKFSSSMSNVVTPRTANWVVFGAGIACTLGAFIRDSEGSNGKSWWDVPSNFFRNNLSERNFKHLQTAAYYTTEYLGKATLVGTAAIACFKLYYGSTVEPVTTLAMLAIGELDRRGYLPQRVSMVLNRCMPIVAAAALIVSTNPLLVKVFAVVLIVNEIAEPILNYFKYHIDDYVSKKYNEIGISYPSLREVEKEQKNFVPGQVFTLQKFSDYLEGKDEFANKDLHCVVDPTHVTRSSKILFDIAGINNFNELLTYYDSIDWSYAGTYRALEKKFLDDDRARGFIAGTMANRNTPEHDELLASDSLKGIDYRLLLEKVLDQKVEIKNKSGKVLQTIPYRLKENCTEEDKKAWNKLVLAYARHEMTLFADSMSGKRRPVGDMTSFSSIKARTKMLIAFLRKTEAEIPTAQAARRRDLEIRKESILMNLAIGGGFYCVPGMDRATRVCMEMAISDTENTATGMIDRLNYTYLQSRVEVIQAWYDSPRQFELYKYYAKFYGGMFNMLLKSFGIDLTAATDHIKIFFGSKPAAEENKKEAEEEDPYSIFNFGLSSDVHSFNEFLRMVSNGNGVDDESAAADRTMGYNPIGEKIQAIILPMFRFAFWNTRTAAPDEFEISKKRIDLFKDRMEDMKNCALRVDQEWDNKQSNVVKKIYVSLKEFFTAIYYYYTLNHKGYFFLVEALANYACYDARRVVDDTVNIFGSTLKAGEYAEWWGNYFDKKADSIPEEKRAEAKEQFLARVFDEEHGAILSEKVEVLVLTSKVEEQIKKDEEQWLSNLATVKISDKDKVWLEKNASDKVNDETTYGDLTERTQLFLKEHWIQNRIEKKLDNIKAELAEKEKLKVILKEGVANDLKKKAKEAISDDEKDFLVTKAFQKRMNMTPAERQKLWQKFDREFRHKKYSELSENEIQSIVESQVSDMDLNVTISAEDRKVLVQREMQMPQEKREAFKAGVRNGLSTYGMLSKEMKDWLLERNVNEEFKKHNFGPVEYRRETRDIQTPNRKFLEFMLIEEGFLKLSTENDEKIVMKRADIGQIVEGLMSGILTGKDPQISNNNSVFAAMKQIEAS